MSTATAPADPSAIAPILADLGLSADALRASGTPHSRLHDVADAAADPAAALRDAERGVGADGALLLRFAPGTSDVALCRWRNALWPAFHWTAIYRQAGGKLKRSDQQSKRELAASLGADAIVVVAQRRAHVMAPKATVAKFDQNAGGWNGNPGKPGYAHYRWMRRYVGCYEAAPQGVRVLDFGSGTGWCGIEAALRFRASALRAFDPSPAMVVFAEQNAKEHGIRDFKGAPGFGEAPPFPAAGESAFELVISSGVISFVPDFDLWLDKLVACVKPGGTLVIGDINPLARGMRERRAARPLVPIRELNAQRASDVRAALEKRGLVFMKSGGYQLTAPIPQAMSWSDAKLGGALSLPLLWLNQLAAAGSGALGGASSGLFDSWVQSFHRRA